MTATVQPGPPSYEQAIQSAENGGQQIPTVTKMSTKRRIIEPIIYVLPFIAAVALLYLATGSSDSWRADLHVMKIGIDANKYQKALHLTSRNFQSSNMSKIFTREDQSAGGWLSFGPWGWCVQAIANKDTACSDRDAWMGDNTIFEDKDGVFEKENVSMVLLHGMLLHCLALLACMVALVPMILNCYKRHYRNNNKCDQGLLHHASLFVASILSLLAWVIDALLINSTKQRMKDAKIEPGPAKTMVGASTGLLFGAFCLAAFPATWRYVQSRRVQLRNLSDVVPIGNVSELKDSEEQASTKPADERSRKKERKGKRSRWGRSRSRR